MLFNSIEFVVFILIFIPLYFSTKGKVRLSLSLGSSYLFYGWWDYRFLGLIILLTLLNFYCGLNISSKTNSKRNYTYLSASIYRKLYCYS
jgi:D-alanyl-lipoteichoic acid acyltransferase DltB (MBOAT superfamily)